MLPETSAPKIVQRRFFCRRQTFEIIREHKLSVSVSSVGSSEAWTLPLNNLSPQSYRSRHFYWQPLLFIVPLLAIMLGTLYGGLWLQVHGRDAGGFYVGALILLVVSGAFAQLIFARSYDVLAFPRSGSSPLYLWYNNPSPEQFQAFAEKLRKAVETAQVAEPRDAQLLSAELARLKVMRDEGLLTEAQFEAGKNKLLGIEPDKRMGF